MKQEIHSRQTICLSQYDLICLPFLVKPTQKIFLIATFCYAYSRVDYKDDMFWSKIQSVLEINLSSIKLYRH